ncbi:MAG: anaerobic ribonucleoside-triphosphate reductase activating protein [Candidatus Peregrinibacteria bacterium]
MLLSALQRLTLLDYPGHIACIAFLPGCNLRCHYCHNSEFVLPEKLEKICHSFIPEEIFLQFLKKRVGKLEGVVISGGEPTIHKNLPEFLRKIKALGFLVKLDTNGTNPTILKKILDEQVVDFVAMDVKVSIEKYGEFCGIPQHSHILPSLKQNITQSRDLLFSSAIDYELRTTLVKNFHDATEFERLCTFVKGTKKWVLQNFRVTGGCLSPKWERFSGFLEDEMQKMVEYARGKGIATEYR